MMELLPDDDPTPVAPVTVEVALDDEPLPPEPEPFVPEPQPVDGPEMPVALVFASKNSGTPHVVTVLELKEGRVVSCCCKAVLNLAHRPKGCWAMVRAREMLGIPPVP